MARFVGAYDYTIDGQGRLILPPSFRSKLAEGAYITAFDGCLVVFPAEEFEAISDRLDESVSDGEFDIEGQREFFSQAADVVPDSQGRIKVKPEHAELVGLHRNVVVAGVGKRIEIWDEERWQAKGTSRSERLAEGISKGIGIGPGTNRSR